MLKGNALHYVVRVTNMPPTELECRCGVRMEGANCLDRMRTHVLEGNAADLAENASDEDR